MAYSKEELMKMYECMARGRIFALKMAEQVFAGNIGISFHSPLGEEATGVGIMSAMRDTDWFIPHHRSQNASLMRFDLYEYLCEFLCRKGGIGGGTTFDSHLSDHDLHVALPIAILGADYPVATGFAWALKFQGKDEVVVVEHGDGASNEGATYEAWNLAALYKVPCVYVITNNGWGMSVPLERHTANPNMSERAVPLGLSNQIVDGNDVLAVRKAMETALEKARRFEPNVVELKTVRGSDHFVGQRAYERSDWQALENAKVDNCPIKRYRDYLVGNGVSTSEELDKIYNEVEADFMKALERALASPKPGFDDVFNKKFVYTNVETGGDL